MSATAWLIIVTLVLAAFGTYKMLARETGFKIIELSDGKTLFGWFKKFFEPEMSEDKKSWWGRKDIESRRWFLYIALAVIAIFVAYLIPDGPDGNGSYRYKIMGAIVLIGLHLVIWPFFTDKTSALTKFLVSAFLIFCVVAFLFPNVADKTWKSVKNQATDFDNNYGKPQVVTSQVAIAPAVYQTGILPPQTLHVIPGERFKKINIPPGRIIKDMTWDCPDGCILEIVHDGQPLCTTNTYQGLPCGALRPDVMGSSTTRYHEQFAIPYGKFINFPRDLVVVGVAFGTDPALGPIEVTATITI